MSTQPRNPGQNEFGDQGPRLFHFAMAAVVAATVIAVFAVILIPNGDSAGGRAGPEGPQSTYMVEVPGIEGRPPVVCVTYNGNGIDCDWRAP